MICKYPNCGRPAKYRIQLLCIGHIAQQNHGKELSPLRRRTAPKDLKETCTFEGCSRKTYRGNLCWTHDMQRANGTELTTIIEPKRNLVCLVNNCLGRNHAKGLCTNHYQLTVKYSLSSERVVELFSDPICEICGKTNIRYTVDHNHQCCSGHKSCGKCVRGILCYTCNLTLGHFNDDPEKIREMLKYLERNQCINP